MWHEIVCLFFCFFFQIINEKQDLKKGKNTNIFKEERPLKSPSDVNWVPVGITTRGLKPRCQNQYIYESFNQFHQILHGYPRVSPTHILWETHFLDSLSVQIMWRGLCLEEEEFSTWAPSLSSSISTEPKFSMNSWGHRLILWRDFLN